MKRLFLMPVIIVGLVACSNKEVTPDITETIEVADSTMFELKARDVVKMGSYNIKVIDEEFGKPTVNVPVFRQQINLKMTHGGKIEGERIRTQYHWGAHEIDDSIVFAEPFTGTWLETQVFQGGPGGNGKKLKLYQIKPAEFPDEVWWMREDHQAIFAYPARYNYVYALDYNGDRAFKIYDFKQY